VAVLGLLIRTRQNRGLREDVSRLTGRIVHLIQMNERQREPLHRIVALAQPGSEIRDEAVTALQMARTGVEDVIRAEPQLKDLGVSLSPTSAEATARKTDDSPEDATRPSSGRPQDR